MSYTKFANSILTSTLWMEDDHTRIVWLTLLAMADKNGEVMASVPGLANIARVPVDSCRIAIAKFLSPDPDSRTKTDEGRRIQEIKGGWALVNHAEYRNLASDEDRKSKTAERMRRYREKVARNSPEPATPGNMSQKVTPDSPSRGREQIQKAEADSKEKKPKVVLSSSPKKSLSEIAGIPPRPVMLQKPVQPVAKKSWDSYVAEPVHADDQTDALPVF